MVAIPSEGINPSLTEETVIASSEAVVMQDNADSPQNLPLMPLLASRPITRLKYQEVPKAELQSVAHEALCYTPKELLEFSNLYRQKSGEHVWEQILRV